MITVGIIIIFWTSADAIYIHINVQHSCPATPGHALASFPPPGAVGLSVLHSRPLRFVRRCAKLQHLLHRLCPPPLRGRRWCLLAFLFFLFFLPPGNRCKKKLKIIIQRGERIKRTKTPGCRRTGAGRAAEFVPRAPRSSPPAAGRGRETRGLLPVPPMPRGDRSSVYFQKKNFLFLLYFRIETRPTPRRAGLPPASEDGKRRSKRQQNETNFGSGETFGSFSFLDFLWSRGESGLFLAS